MSLSLGGPVRSADPDLSEEEDYSGLPSETIKSLVCEWNVLSLTRRLLASNWKLSLGLCSMYDSSRGRCRHKTGEFGNIDSRGVEWFSKLITCRFKAPYSSGVLLYNLLWLCDADKCSWAQRLKAHECEDLNILDVSWQQDWDWEMDDWEKWS